MKKIFSIIYYYVLFQFNVKHPKTLCFSFSFYIFDDIFISDLMQMVNYAE